MIFSVFFFFKQKTAYEMRISDWSSDVCSSDLLGGDGLDFVSSAAGVAFDHDGDGVREATSWAGRGDGILVRDANGDGIANNGGEIVLSVAGSTDLEGLRLQYDSEGHGMLSAAGADFPSIGVWQAANGDGVTLPVEFR